MEDVEYVSKKINNESFDLRKREFDLSLYVDEIKKLNAIDFCSFQFKFSTHYTHKFLVTLNFL